MNTDWLMRVAREEERIGEELQRIVLVTGWELVPGITRTPEEVARLAEEEYGPARSAGIGELAARTA